MTAKVIALSVPPKSDRRRARTRQALMDAGRTLLAQRHVDGVSVDEIVAAAAVAKGSFYNHFADKDVFAREIGTMVRRHAEQAVNEANIGVQDPAKHLARAVCVFVRFAIEHRESAQVLWRLNAGATMADAPINRALRENLLAGIRSRRFKHVDIESAVLLVIGIIIVTLRHALEERIVTPPKKIAQHAAAGLLRSLGVSAAQSLQLATAAASNIFANTTHIRGRS
ncbi:MAG TPA: helix-turn-helix domain-containing protein [Steroidobacteraceae bacterium]|nr:helix-turn-helix domain-containing protein [Steroidobacteraceae bacterium]